MLANKLSELEVILIERGEINLNKFLSKQWFAIIDNFLSVIYASYSCTVLSGDSFYSYTFVL